MPSVQFPLVKNNVTNLKQNPITILRVVEHSHTIKAKTLQDFQNIITSCLEISNSTSNKKRLPKAASLNPRALPTLTWSRLHTTIGPERLNGRVRNGTGCFPLWYRHPRKPRRITGNCIGSYKVKASAY